ncbi:DUF4142 domain-containing protein (plasmid) [Sphingomonas sp. AAP5]|uniref:DUF4142 domain-containing protein n=1 Tax=Sphingomonas sp. AAP5 TaxID=1523415 RepID=UPI0010573A2F|nr:DUF4142 domain-containing protein [Sphingomonas sp. AAP5]QBM77955.1 DUF4142 domain-containing protein [Sphingomonas sp. AAP5]
MRTLLGMSLCALAMASSAVPFSPSLAQSGISTNPAPVETIGYSSAVEALSKYEVDSSRLALARSQDKALRVFAQQMVEHHSRQVPSRSGVGGSGAGGALDGPLSEMLNSLENVPSAEFNAAYKRGQIAAHEEALKVHGAYAARGSDSTARAKAEAAMPAIQKHLNAARNLPSA